MDEEVFRETLVELLEGGHAHATAKQAVTRRRSPYRSMARSRARTWSARCSMPAPIVWWCGRPMLKPSLRWATSSSA